MTTPLIITLVVLVALVCAAVLLSISRRRKAQDELVRRVRSSNLYGHLYPLLLHCRTRCVESITIKTDSVCIRLYKPAGRTLLYTFDKHDIDPLPREYLYALARAVAVELPLLRDGDRYTFRTCTEQQPMGERSTYYEYTITTDYKDSMLRAEYMAKSRG